MTKQAFEMVEGYHDLCIGESVTPDGEGTKHVVRLLAGDETSVSVRVGNVERTLILGHFQNRHLPNPPNDVPSVVEVGGLRIGADLTKPFMSGSVYSQSLVNLETDARLFIGSARDPLSPPGRHVFPVPDTDWNYGENWLQKVKYGWHLGVDVDEEQGHPLVAATDGTVLAIRRFDPSVQQEDYWGNGLAMLGDDGFVYIYMHWDELAEGVVRGARLAAGDLIGPMGRSGFDSTTITTHLHFEMLVMKHPERFTFAFETEPEVLPTPNRILPTEVEGFVVNPYPYLVEWYEGR